MESAKSDITPHPTQVFASILRCKPHYNYYYLSAYGLYSYKQAQEIIPQYTKKHHC